MANTLPATMIAIKATEPGPADVLKPVELPMPVPGENELLVKVGGAGVNRPDIVQRLGHYPPPKGAPDTLGLEIAGEVVAVGRNAGKFKPGDKLCALVPGGGYAEYCVCHEDNALPIPGDLTVAEAGGLPEAFFTVWANIFERGALQPGETLLVHGGTSGIGTSAIQMATALYGTTVFTTAGSDEKCAAAVKLGANRAINYMSEDFADIVKQETDGRGADVILDMVGGDYIERNIKAAAPDGRIVNIAFLNGSIAEINFMPVMLKRLTLTGSTLRIRPVEEKARIAEQLRKKIWPLIADGQIRPLIHKEFPLAKAAQAHQLMETSRHIGKIMLRP